MGLGVYSHNMIQVEGKCWSIANGSTIITRRRTLCSLRCSMVTSMWLWFQHSFDCKSILKNRPPRAGLNNCIRRPFPSWHFQTFWKTVIWSIEIPDRRNAMSPRFCVPTSVILVLMRSTARWRSKPRSSYSSTNSSVVHPRMRKISDPSGAAPPSPFLGRSACTNRRFCFISRTCDTSDFKHTSFLGRRSFIYTHLSLFDSCHKNHLAHIRRWSTVLCGSIDCLFLLSCPFRRMQTV